MPNGTSERSALIEHCGVGGSVGKGTLYPMWCGSHMTSDEFLPRACYYLYGDW